MDNEISYSKKAGAEHIKAFGQYFTDSAVADFMCCWACKGAKTMLDPAAGSSVFLRYARKYAPDCQLTGYEIDGEMLRHFGNPASAEMKNEDYLLGDWNGRYDAIVCNPPYNRFQAVSNRSEILKTIFEHTGEKPSGYTNLYVLFLIKSIRQLSERGRLAYIVPSEFMNSKYGAAIKRQLVNERLLRAVINLENDRELFGSAATTCCILLLDREPKSSVAFYNLASIKELRPELLAGEPDSLLRVDYDSLKADEKWLPYLLREMPAEYANLKPISDFCTVARGIATGANDYFCFSLSKAGKLGIPDRCLSKCVCRSADVKSPVFRPEDFEKLSEADRTVYLLNVTEESCEAVKPYIEQGLECGIDKKYLPASRKPWYSMERKPIAPIWVSSACREKIKFVRNLAMTSSLTTFHSVFVNEPYEKDTDLIFCYFLTSAAQRIIRENRKELGNGLDKFQPSDLNSAKMLDIGLISPRDRAEILAIYDEMLKGTDASQIRRLDEIFSSYLTK